MGSIKFTTNAVLATLFAIAIITFAINFGIDNNSAVKLGDDSDFSSINADLKSNVTQFRKDTNSSSSAFFTSTIEPGDETVATGGQFKVGIGNVLNMLGSIMKGTYTKIFGEDNSFGLFLSALSGILLVVSIAYAWKAWRGNPD